MMTRRGKGILLVGLALMLGMVSQPLWAHVHVIDRQPGDGEVVAKSPETLGIRFDAPIRITHFEVTGPQGVVELNGRPDAALVEHYQTVPADALTPGEYRVSWRGIAEDGHTMSGDYRFSVQE